MTACDCGETRVGLLDHIDRELEFSGALSDEQRARLVDIANKCPVHRTLVSEIVIQTRMAGGSADAGLDMTNASDLIDLRLHNARDNEASLYDSRDWRHRRHRE